MAQLLEAALKWLAIARWWSFFTDFIAVTAGSLMALPSFSVLLYMAMLAGTISINAFANFMNDIYDFRNGEGGRNRPMEAQPNPIARHTASMRELWRASAMSIAIAAVSGAYIMAHRGIAILVLGLIGMSAAYFYSAGRRSIKSLALGEPLVFVIFGPIMTSSAYFVESGSISIGAIAISVIIGTLVMLVLLANNVRDISSDKAAGARTLATMVGQRFGARLFVCIVALSYVLLAAFAAIGALPLISLLALISLPYAIYVCRLMLHRSVPRNCAELTARLALLFSMLLFIGIIAQRLLLPV
jgi:1,4-dihydroxy-2-naphthoate octaprenyltransferase